MESFAIHLSAHSSSFPMLGRPPTARPGAFTRPAAARLVDFNILTLAMPASTSGWPLRCTSDRDHLTDLYTMEFFKVWEHGHADNLRDAFALTGKVDIFEQLASVIQIERNIFFSRRVIELYPSLYEKSDAARIVTLLDKVVQECLEGYVRATTLLGGIDALDEVAKFFTNSEFPSPYSGIREIPSRDTKDKDEFFDELIKEFLRRCDALGAAAKSVGK